MNVKVVDTLSVFEYNKTASFVYSTANTTPILTLLDPKPGDKIIDFGCGTGEITLKLSEVVAGPGVAVGIDSSQRMASAQSLQRNATHFSSAAADQQGQGKRVRKRPCPRYPGAGRRVCVSACVQARSVRQGL